MTTTIRNDPEPLSALECRIERIRDRVKSVAFEYHTACYLVGRPGTSKTHTVMDELKRLEQVGKPHAYRNARMTPMGLFDFIAEHPEHVIVLDDIGTLFKNDQAMQILMAATGGDPGKPRKVTYKSKDKQEDVDFSGGIIAISNVALRHDPLARAFGSRVVVLEHEPTNEEIAAFMRHLAARGYEDMSPEECLEVAVDPGVYRVALYSLDHGEACVVIAGRTDLESARNPPPASEPRHGQSIGGILVT